MLDFKLSSPLGEQIFHIPYFHVLKENSRFQTMKGQMGGVTLWKLSNVFGYDNEYSSVTGSQIRQQ